MADTGNNGSRIPTPPKQENMEVRLLAAFLLMGVVMYVTSSYYKPATPPAGSKGATSASAGATGAKGSVVDAAAASQAKTAPAAAAAAPAILPAGATPQNPEPPCVIETDFYKVVFSNQGATVRSWQLRKTKGSDNKALDLVNTASGMDYPFSLHFAGDKPAINVNWTWYKQTVAADRLGVSYEFSDGHITVRKKFQFAKDKYLTRVESEVSLDGKPLPHLLQWRGGFGDLTIPNPAGYQRTLYFDAGENKLVETAASDAAKGAKPAGGNYNFAGIADGYFGAVFLPENGVAMQTISFGDTVKTPPTKANPATSKPVPLSGVAVGGSGTNRYDVFIGPKDIDLLRRIDPKLEQVVDFGWLWFLAKPLFLVVNYVNLTLVHNFGWAIVLVTIFINIALFPLRLSSMKSGAKMRALQPQVDAINARVKNLGPFDPKKQEVQQEVMTLYTKNGVNPLGGCLPLVLQMPFLFAFYKVFTVSAEMRHAPWLWVMDLSQPEPWDIKVLPLVMIASQFLMQQMMPQPQTDPAQRKMMMLMPVMFGFMFYNLPSGLVLYYLTSNLVGIAQQWFFNQTSMANVAIDVIAPKNKSGRK